MRREAPFHPILLALYTILFTYAHATDVAPSGSAMAMWLALCVGGAAMLWGAFTWVSGDARKGAVAVSVFIVMFFSYGHLKNFMTAPAFEALASIRIGPLKILAGLWAVAWLSLATWLRKASPNAVVTATAALNRAGLALVIVIAVSLGVDAYASGHEQHLRRPAAPTGATVASPNEAVASRQELPDIYYIILDDYARSDILKDLYHYDNTAFMAWLRARGFYTADESHSNYSQTMLSLASSLNSVYLDPIQLTSGAPTDKSGGRLAQEASPDRPASYAGTTTVVHTGSPVRVTLAGRWATVIAPAGAWWRSRRSTLPQWSNHVEAAGVALTRSVVPVR